MSGHEAAENDMDRPGTAPAVVIVMGVSGCGKSTIAELLAARLGGCFEDGDELHPKANIDKMSNGVPLTDEDRQPWLEAVRDHAAEAAREHGLSIVACSALKRRYRETLRGAARRGVDASPDSPAEVSVFHVFLEGSRELIAARMGERKGHFMPTTMLDSQFAALESPVGEPRVVVVDITPEPEAIARAAAEALAARDDFPAPDSPPDSDPS